jgi:hypothetical protein
MMTACAFRYLVNSPRSNSLDINVVYDVDKPISLRFNSRIPAKKRTKWYAPVMKVTTTANTNPPLFVVLGSYNFEKKSSQQGGHDYFVQWHKFRSGFIDEREYGFSEIL